MVTPQERLLKMEHDAWLANSQALTNAANVDYIAMMSGIDIPTEEVSGIDIPTEEVLENESEV